MYLAYLMSLRFEPAALQHWICGSSSFISPMHQTLGNRQVATDSKKKTIALNIEGMQM